MASNLNYDSVIADHYKNVANQEGDNSTSTMADRFIREQETRAIISFVEETKNLNDSSNGQTVNVMDVGCGNGYTLNILSELFPSFNFLGVEKTKELREIAIERFKSTPNVTIIEGDIRDKNFSNEYIADILICQRVLINLLDSKDQSKALLNIINNVSSLEKNGKKGYLLFLESFSSALENLNTAREEFNLDKIRPAHHNLYLKDSFFQVDEVTPFIASNNQYPSNFLSTHYYITRAFHPHIIKDEKVKRNSEFVSFFSQALQKNVGDYSPLKLILLEKI